MHSMFAENQAADPAVHQQAMKMARRFVWIIQAILREEERGLAVQEAYRVAREGLEEYIDFQRTAETASRPGPASVSGRNRPGEAANGGA
jgi:hypothetical protein